MPLNSTKKSQNARNRFFLFSSRIVKPLVKPLVELLVKLLVKPLKICP
jgi:hypothetical protein